MKPTPIIRPEVETDTQAIREITRAAFEHMPFAAGDEHELIDTLRAQSRLYLSLVAQWQGQVVGHIAFSRDHGRPLSALVCPRTCLGNALTARNGHWGRPR